MLIKPLKLIREWIPNLVPIKPWLYSSNKQKSETRIKLRTSISKFTLCHINRVLFQTHKQTHALCRALTWWLMKTSNTNLTFTVTRVSNTKRMKGDFCSWHAKINLLVRDEPNFWRPLTIHTDIRWYFLFKTVRNRNQIKLHWFVYFF